MSALWAFVNQSVRVVFLRDFDDFISKMSSKLEKLVDIRSKSEEIDVSHSRDFDVALKMDRLQREIEHVKKQNICLRELNRVLEQRIQCLESRCGVLEPHERSRQELKAENVICDGSVTSTCSAELLEISTKCDLFRLNEDIFVKIFSYLNTRDLFVLRQVSKRLKNLVETYLQSEKEMNIRSEFVLTENLNVLSSLYPNLKTLTIRSVNRLERQPSFVCNASFSAILYLWKDSFVGLEWLKVHDAASRFTPVDISLIGDCFTYLTALTLSCVKSKDEVVSHLFRKLVNLRSIELENVPIRGHCFADLSTVVTTVRWSTSDIDLVEDICFCSHKPNALKSFGFNSIGDQDGHRIIGVIMREMPNLQYLRLEVLFGIQYFDDLNLKELQEFELRVSEIYGSYILNEPMPNVKKLSLAVHRMCDTNLAHILSNFPEVEHLSLDFSENSRFQFSAKVVEALCNLRSLKTLVFKDASNFRDQYLLLNGRHNAVIVAIEYLTFVKKFIIELNFSRNEAFCFSILCNVEEIAQNRPNDMFYIRLLRGYRIERKFPPNMVVYFNDY
ncbi:hypothetical protein B4U80_13365 [Leptotrombidium deliense]|uniref:F-box domain-containing protein n=1 Tax=Leptotrombidium deliense TaxID=299467 RepID=A0A443S7L4_9ACAR|nr:hypothetical protein B4U80_13365 [Leptotrombidium deliense]